MSGIKKCCETCKFVGVEGLSGPNNKYFPGCYAPIPHWVESQLDLSVASIVDLENGENCECYQPKDEPDEKINKLSERVATLENMQKSTNDYEKFQDEKLNILSGRTSDVQNWLMENKPKLEARIETLEAMEKNTVRDLVSRVGVLELRASFESEDDWDATREDQNSGQAPQGEKR